MTPLPKSISPWWGLPPIVGLILLLPLRPETCACAPPPTNELAVLAIAQKVYFEEHGHFADDFPKLLPITGRNPSSASFEITMDVMDDRVIIYGTLKKEHPTDLLGLGIWKQNLPNMIMAVGKGKKLDRQKLIQIKCVGKQNSLTKPNPPTFDGVKFTCPDGFYDPSATTNPPN